MAAEEYALPSDYKSIVSLYHDGASYYGGIKVVEPEELADRKTQLGDTGVPSYVAVITATEPPTLRFAPEPSGTYTLRLVYERQLDPLSDSNTDNQLLTDAPDIYLYAALSEAESYLQEDERVQLWESKLEAAVKQYKINQDRKEFGGRLVARPRRMIGGDV